VSTAKTGNINGRRGQTGARQFLSFDADFTVAEYMGGKTIETFGPVTVTLPLGECGSGYATEVLLRSGSVTFAAEPGVSIVGDLGALGLSLPYQTAFLRRLPNSDWLVDGTPPSDGPTGLASPLLFGRNGTLAANVYLRLAGNVVGGATTAYPVTAGSRLRFLAVRTATAPGADVPIVVVANGVDVATATLAAGTTSTTLILNVTVPDSGSGVGYVAVRTGTTTAPLALDASVSLWTEEA